MYLPCLAADRRLCAELYMKKFRLQEEDNLILFDMRSTHSGILF